MSAPVTDPATEPSAEPPNRGVAVPVAVGMVVAAVVAVLVVVGSVASLTTDRLPSGPALPPPAAQAPEVAYDQSTRGVRYAGVGVTMPGDPYACTGPDSFLPLLVSAVVCGATVHQDYSGSSDWSATAGFGPVPDDLRRPTAEQTAETLFQQFRSEGFGSHPTTLERRQVQQTTLGGHQVAVVNGDVHYEVPGVASTYDRVLIIVLPLDDGGYVAYFSSRPNDTATSTLDILNASIQSLHYR